MDDGNDHDGKGNTTPFDPSTCPVTLGCLLPFVTSRTLFRTPDDNSSGNQHVAFLLEHAMKTWADEAQKSSETLGSAYFARQHHDNFKGKGRNNLALVCMKHPGLGIQSATFVHWQNRGETGRPVELDNLNRVKAVVCVGALREALDLRHASMTIQMLEFLCCGLVVTKCKIDQQCLRKSAVYKLCVNMLYVSQMMISTLGPSPGQCIISRVCSVRAE